MSASALTTAPARLLAAQAFSRAAGAPLVDGNAVELLDDAAAHFEAWLAAIRGARRQVLLENYSVRDDAVGREFRDALAERARAGVRVAVIRDWLGCLGQSRAGFWQPLLAAGGEVRVYNPPHAASPFGWISRDHRKLLAVDGRFGSVSGVCLSAKWLGDPARRVAPWRDTGVTIRGPAVAELERAFAENWARLGAPWPTDAAAPVLAEPAGKVALRVIATQPNMAGMLRLDQLIAAMARRTLWLTDAYFVGIAAYVQALAAAARDGVDVRLLVPGSSDVPVVAALSRAGYRPLLEAGVRVFEWNGSMLHAKTAVADGQWARVGSTNLNVASWMGNCEIDVAVEDAGFAAALAAQYERDLGNATEVVLSARRRPCRTAPAPPRAHRASGSSGRAAASAMRFANTVGAALTDHRELGAAEAGPLLGAAALLCALAVVFALWPRVLAWPLTVLALWLAIGLAVRSRALRRRARRESDAQGPC
ncbi:MAG: phospholipase D-like domain-containing protein [Mizugakiibacter sp.]|uniref:phospholipase D-like domain-containing protein n=1 Tax=Mizugakiibacter sp. TaxID=1972610 RepID=UPI0031C41DE9|nr:phospholipase D-like domain-containing protein [Xanthomonadaceae bacterium]